LCRSIAAYLDEAERLALFGQPDVVCVSTCDAANPSQSRAKGRNHNTNKVLQQRAQSISPAYRLISTPSTVFTWPQGRSLLRASSTNELSVCPRCDRASSTVNGICPSLDLCLDLSAQTQNPTGSCCVRLCSWRLRPLPALLLILMPSGTKMRESARGFFSGGVSRLKVSWHVNLGSLRLVFVRFLSYRLFCRPALEINWK
jgi:hypothetical protein